MFNRILVAVDDSENNSHVFEAALFLAKAANARLMLLDVLPSKGIDYAKTYRFSNLDTHPNTYDEVPFDSKASQDDKSRGWKILRSLQAVATTAGIMADLAQLQGDPNQVIPDEAGKWGADLIILGWQGLTGLNKSTSDSFNKYTPHHPSYSILIVERQTCLSYSAPQDNQERVEMVSGFASNNL